MMVILTFCHVLVKYTFCTNIHTVQVKWLEQQVSKKRIKRDATAHLYNDPKWPKMWYLVRYIACI